MRETPIVFKSQGEQIIGMLHLPKKKNPPLIIMCHGWGANKLGTWLGLFVYSARILCQNGFAVLRFDFRGSGDSEGRFERQTISIQLIDLKSIIDQIIKMNIIDSSRIGLIGHSKGGEVSLIYAQKDKRIKCLTTWASPAGIKELWSPSLITELHKKGYVTFDNRKITLKNFKDDSKYNLKKILKKIKCPVFVVGCNNDDNVAPSQANKIYSNLTGKKKIFLIDTDHYFSDNESKRKVTKLTIKWFKKWLKK